MFLFEEAHEGVCKGHTFVHLEDLAVDGIEKAATEGEDGITDFVGLHKVLLAAVLAKEIDVLGAEDFKDSVGEDVAGADDVESDIVACEVFGDVAAQGFHDGFGGGDKLIVGEVVIGAIARYPDDVAGVATKDFVDLLGVGGERPGTVLQAFEEGAFAVAFDALGRLDDTDIADEDFDGLVILLDDIEEAEGFFVGDHVGLHDGRAEGADRFELGVDLVFFGGVPFVGEIDLGTGAAKGKACGKADPFGSSGDNDGFAAKIISHRRVLSFAG